MYRNVGGLWAETGIATLTKIDGSEARTPVINFEKLVEVNCNIFYLKINLNNRTTRAADDS